MNNLNGNYKHCGNQGRRQRILKAGAEGVLDHWPGELRNCVYIYIYIYYIANLEIFLF